MIGAISGGAGDTVYAVPTMKQLGITHLYIKDNRYDPEYDGQYLFLKRFIELQGIQCLPTKGGYDFFQYEPGLIYDIDFDQSRKQPRRGHTHIMRSFANHFRVKMPDIHKPFLKVDDKKSLLNEWVGPYSLIFLTPRWREKSKIDWKKVLKSIEGDIFFIGFESDWELFRKNIGSVHFIRTKDLLDIARLIRDCQALYCNQNVGLTVAQGLCKKHYLEVKPFRTNTVLLQKNEILLDYKFFM
jgi:hypothetical protein